MPKFSNEVFSTEQFATGKDAAALRSRSSRKRKDGSALCS